MRGYLLEGKQITGDSPNAVNIPLIRQISHLLAVSLRPCFRGVTYLCCSILYYIVAAHWYSLVVGTASTIYWRRLQRTETLMCGYLSVERT